jgi:hypothetical protein
MKSMMRNSISLLAALCATTIVAAGATWAANPALKQEASVTPQQAMADKDLGKFSADGATAFEDIALTRRAIFEGRTDDAKKFVALADAGFKKAKADDSVFTKAEADLKSPPSKGSAAKASDAAPTTDAANAKPMKAPIAWVPIDGSITITEDITGNAAKTAAVGDANKSLQSGDRESAVKKRKRTSASI